MKEIGKKVQFQLRLGLFCLFLLLLFSGCQQETGSVTSPLAEELISTQYLNEGAKNLPYIGLVEKSHLILPLFPSSTQVKVGSYRYGQAISDQEGFEFWVKGDWANYRKKIQLYQVADGQLLWEEASFDLAFKPDQLKEDTLYLIRLVLSDGEGDYFYDLPFYYQRTGNFSQKILSILEEVYKSRQADEKPMGEIAVTVDMVTKEGLIRGRAKQVVALRKEGGFEYLDKSYDFTIQANGDQDLRETILNKKRGKYDKVKNNVVLADQGQWYEHAGRFVQVLEQEVYAGDAQNIYTLYRADEINEDYLIDELSYLKFQAIAWKNNRFYFLAYGTFGPEILALGNRRGLAVFQWDGQELSIPFFAEVDQADIDQYIKDHLLVYEKEARLIWLNSASYFILDLVGGRLRRSEIPIDSQVDKELGLVYWQAQADKTNQTILWNDMGQEKLHMIFKEDKNQKIIGLGTKGIYVGEYSLGDSLEYLDRQVVYPFTRIVLYDLDGTIKKQVTPDQDQYLAMPVFDKKDVGYIPVLEKKYGGQTQLGERKLDYVVVDKIDFDFRDIPANQLDPGILATSSFGLGQDFYGTRIRIMSGTAQKLTYKKERTALLNWEEKPEFSHYRLVGPEKEVLTVDLKAALIQADGLAPYQIYYRGGQEEKALFDTGWKKPAFKLESFPMVSQLPELPRGCEVTALSMLLRYYNPEFPDRLHLAELLTQYSAQVTGPSQTYQVDMKEAFAGSIYDSNQPGLGVYIEPISLIARRYVGTKAQNITGASLDQILTFVSRGRPVQVIVPDRAQAIPDHLRTTWQTNKGYIQVTYREHSVVVIGFDATYVFYADPLTGQMARSLLKDFEAGFEAFGRQALVITE